MATQRRGELYPVFLDTVEASAHVVESCDLEHHVDAAAGNGQFAQSETVLARIAAVEEVHLRVACGRGHIENVRQPETVPEPKGGLGREVVGGRQHYVA